MDDNAQSYLEPTEEAGRAFFSRNYSGSVVMLNLMRFRPIADYSAAPHLKPESPITGEAAYRLYMEHTLPYLKKSGGEVLFYGRGGEFLIGPQRTMGRDDVGPAIESAVIPGIRIGPRISRRHGTSDGCFGGLAIAPGCGAKP